MPSLIGPVVAPVRSALFEALRSRVAGDDGPRLARQIWEEDGPRWFAEGTAIRRVHADAAMYIGGIRALLVQSLHPLAMAAVAGHSGFRGDPWGRLQRTSAFLAMTTYGPAPRAEALVGRINKIHQRVRGFTRDGIPYHAADPHLLKWVHLSEVDSFADAYGRYGGEPLTDADRDDYAAQTAVVADKLGVLDPPTTWAQVQEQLTAYVPELKATPESRDTAKFLLLDPPLPVVARPAYALLTTSAVASLPRWARRHIRVPRLGLVESVVGTGTGRLATAAIRWAMTGPREDPSAA